MRQLICMATGVGLCIAMICAISLVGSVALYLASWRYIPFAWAFWISLGSLIVLIGYSCVIREEAERSK